MKRWVGQITAWAMITVGSLGVWDYGWRPWGFMFLAVVGTGLNAYFYMTRPLVLTGKERERE